MSVGSWFKDLFFEEESKVEKTEEKSSEEVKNEVKQHHDYNLKIFDIARKDQVTNVTNYIIQDKTLALVKMHKFTGNKDDLKEILNELKKSCESSNSKIVGLTNNMYFITKNSISVEKEENNSL